MPTVPKLPCRKEEVLIMNTVPSAAAQPSPEEITVAPCPAPAYVDVVRSSNPMSSRGRLSKYLDPEHPATKSLDKHGVAIIRVCSKEEVAQLRSALWDDMEALGTGIKRNDPKTWKVKNWPQSSHGLLQNQHFGLRLSVCMARLKCVDALKPIFLNALINSSFDAISVARPECQDRAYKKELRLNKLYKEGDALVSSWLHIDQANTKSDCFTHIQGAFALDDLTKAEQRTQFIIPKVDSDETIQRFRDRFLLAFPPSHEAKKSGFDAERAEWISFGLKDKIKDTDPLVIAKRKWLIEYGHVYTPTLEAGEMVLWDSGVPHASIPGPCTGNTRKVRMSTFVSMLPAELVSDEERIVRNEMLENLETSGHRVTTFGKSGKVLKCKFNETGRTYGKTIPEFDKSRVVRASKRALYSSDDNTGSVAYKTQRLCAGKGI